MYRRIGAREEECASALPYAVHVSGNGASIVLSAAIVALVVAIAQLADLRAPILTGSDKSMQQYESFRLHVERDGHHELVVFGNSIARQSVNIQQLQRQVEPVLGRPLVAYNFAAGGTPPNALDVLVDLVYSLDAPEICVVVLTVMMTAARNEAVIERANMMHESPYGRALRDPVPWRGPLQQWLLDNVAFTRLRYALREAALGELPSERQPGVYNPERGYKQTQKRATSGKSWESVLEKMRNARFETEEKRQVLLEMVRGIQAHGAEVWLVEGAFHPRRFAALPDCQVL